MGVEVRFEARDDVVAVNDEMKDNVTIQKNSIFNKTLY